MNTSTPTISLHNGSNQIAFANIHNGCLDIIGVVDDWRRKGIGTKILEMVFVHMKNTKTRILHFEQYNPDFWIKMKQKFPKNVKLFNDGAGLLIVS